MTTDYSDALAEADELEPDAEADPVGEPEAPRILDTEGNIQTRFSQAFNVSSKVTQFGGEQEMTDEHRAEIQAVIAEITRQNTTKSDFVTHTRLMRAVVDESRVMDPLTLEFRTEHDLVIDFELEDGLHMKLKVTRLAHDQIATTLGVGVYLYSKLVEAEEETPGARKQALNLLADVVNHFLQKAEKRVLIRTVDNQVRAILSPDYLPRDNYDLLFALLEPITEVRAEVRQLFVSPKRFYLRALHPEWKERVTRQNLDVQERGQIFQDWMADLKADPDGNIPYFSRLNPVNDDPYSGLGTDGGFGLGPVVKDRVITGSWDDDWVIPGIHAQNSEVGHGGTVIGAFAMRQICMNGTTMDAPIAARHALRGANPLDGFISYETHQKINAALWAEIQDLVRAVFDAEKFKAMVEQMSTAANQLITRPTIAVNRVMNTYQISPKRRQELLNYLIIGNDPTQWGLINAVTAMARETPDIDERMELELVGGKMVEAVR